MAGNPARVQDLHELSRIWTRRKLRVMENPGWETYGRSSTMTFDAMGIHHTGAGVDLDRLLHDGRPDVSGPLANVALHARSALPGFIGEVVLMASGRANHFGVATWSSSRALGVEATGPPFTNYPAYVQLAAGFCEWKGADPAKVLRSDTAIDVYLLAAHKEVAVDAQGRYGRKQDPSGFGWPSSGRTIAGVLLIDGFRNDVRAALTAPAEEDDMHLTEAAIDKIVDRWQEKYGKRLAQWIAGGANAVYSPSTAGVPEAPLTPAEHRNLHSPATPPPPPA